MKKILISLLSILLLGLIGVSWMLSNKILKPNSSHHRTVSRIASGWNMSYEQMLATLPNPQNISITSFDGTQLRGKYFAKSDTGNCAIILAHGWSSTWAGMLKYTPTLADCSCDLLFFDHRSHGESDPSLPTGGVNEGKDILAATDWLNENKGFQDENIGWYGASWGGSAVLIAGKNQRNVGFIIADAPFQNWYSAVFERAIRDYGSGIRLLSWPVFKIVDLRTGASHAEASALQAAEEIDEPVLLIHSQMDAETASSQSVNIAKILKPDRSQFYHLEWGGGHTKDVLLHTDKFKSLVDEFISGIDWNCN